MSLPDFLANHASIQSIAPVSLKLDMKEGSVTKLSQLRALRDTLPPTVRALDLSGHMFLGSNTEEIEAIAEMTRLRELNLGKNAMGNRHDYRYSLRAVEAISGMPNIDTLLLGSNDIGGGDFGVTKVRAIARMQRLRVLDLSYNSIGNEDQRQGIAQIQAIVGIKRLRSLNLAGNDFLCSIRFLQDSYLDSSFDHIYAALHVPPLYMNLSIHSQPILRHPGTTDAERQAVFDALAKLYPDEQLPANLLTDQKTLAAFIMKHHGKSERPGYDFVKSFQEAIPEDHPLSTHLLQKTKLLAQAEMPDLHTLNLRYTAIDEHQFHTFLAEAYRRTIDTHGNTASMVNLQSFNDAPLPDELELLRRDAKKTYDAAQSAHLESLKSPQIKARSIAPASKDLRRTGRKRGRAADEASGPEE